MQIMWNLNSNCKFIRSEIYPQESGKLTGMMLEMDKALLVQLVNQPNQLVEKAKEAIQVLHEHDTSLI